MRGFKRTMAFALSLLLILSLFTYAPIVRAVPSEFVTATIGYDRDNLNAGDIFYNEVKLTSKTTIIDVTTLSSLIIRLAPATGYRVNQIFYDDNDIDVILDENTMTYTIVPNSGDESFVRPFQFLVEFTEQDNISQVRTTSNELVFGAYINYYRMDGDNISDTSSYSTTTDINGIFTKYEIPDDNWYLVAVDKGEVKAYTITDRNSPAVWITIPSGVSEVDSDSTTFTMDNNGIKVTTTSSIVASHFYIEPLLRYPYAIGLYGFPSVNYANEQLVTLGSYYNDPNINHLEDNQEFVVYYLEETIHEDHSTFELVGYQVATYDKPIINRVIDTSFNLVTDSSVSIYYRNLDNNNSIVGSASYNGGYFVFNEGVETGNYFLNASTTERAGYNKYNPSGMDIMLYNKTGITTGGGLSEISMGVFTDEIEGSRGEVRLETRSSTFPSATHFDAHVLFDGWDLATHGLPTPNNIGSIGSPDNIDLVPIDGETYKVMILYYTLNDDKYTFLGYDIVDYIYEDSGPGGPGGPSPSRTINFEVNGTVQSIEAQRDLLVYVPVSEGAISIEFLDSPNSVWIDPILPVSVAEMDGDINAISNWLSEIGATVSGSSISFGSDKPLKRINAVVEYEGDEYRIVFMQPGYDDAEISLDFRDDLSRPITIPIDNEEPPNVWRVYRYELPVRDNFQVEYSVTMTNSPETFFTGVLEYNVDRDAFVSVNHENESFELITANRGYGSVELHCQYHLGNSWEDAFVIFYEADFFTLDIEPDFRIADWESGVTNLSESWTYTQPVSYAYFMNSFVNLWIPDYLNNYSLNRVSIFGEDISQHADGYWRIPLAGQYDEDTLVNLEIQKGSEEPYYKQLIIRKTALGTQSGYWSEDVDNNPIDETLMAYIKAYGSDVQPLDMMHPEDMVYPEFDIRGKVIVVNYYNNDKIIGTKEFLIPSDLPNYDEMSFDRKMYEVKVYDEFDPEFIDVRSANRISTFLLNNSLRDSFFDGARFGFGAGWGHLLPTHPEWGSGKDGMEFERGGSR